MATLIVWKSGTADGAERAGVALRDLPDTERASVQDAALVCWPRGSNKPATRRLDDLSSDQALGDDFWGVLFGLIFYSPLLGAAVESPAEAISGSFADVGIDDTFVNRVRDALCPGTSALFVLGSDSLARGLPGAHGTDPQGDVLVTRFTARQEETLRQVFVG